MFIGILFVLVYLVIAYFAYNKYISKFNNKKWEKVIFSIVWPFVLIMYGIRKIQEKS